MQVGIAVAYNVWEVKLDQINRYKDYISQTHLLLTYIVGNWDPNLHFMSQFM